MTSQLLVVDNDPSVCESLAMSLESAGYTVSTAYNGFEALVQLRRTPAFDLVVADLNLPQMSGSSFLSVVHWRFPGIPIIAFSGAGHSGETKPRESMDEAFHAANLHHPKPLLRSVADLIRIFERSISANRGNATPVRIPQNASNAFSTGLLRKP